MNHFTRRVAVALALFQALTMVLSPHLTAAFKRVHVGDSPPDFTLADSAGKEWRAAELLKEKVSVVVFWATWSPRSAEILRDLESFRGELGGDSFQIVAINADHEEFSGADRAAIDSMVGEMGFTSPVLLDEGLVTYNRYGAMALPSSLVVGKEGKVSYVLAGYPTTIRSDLFDAVRAALGLPTSSELRPPEEYVPKNHALMYYNFGRRLMEKGQEEKGEAQLLVSVERDPEFKKSRLLLGLYYRKTGRHEDALREFMKVKEIDPKDQEAAFQVAAVSLRMARFDEAETLFGELNEEFPEREEFALGLALAHKYQKHEEDYLGAAELASTLLAAAPNYLYQLGGVAETQNDLDIATAFYRRALEGALDLPQAR